MGYIASHLMDLIGNTPLLSLNNYKSKVGYDAEIIVKLEFFNPAGSVKDRIAYGMIKDAENKKSFNKGLGDC